jgi:nucleotide-binding universal stress UspA family protein
MATVALTQEQKEWSVDFKRILIATDFSAPSERALGYAVAIARRYGSEISIVHAIPPEPRESVTMDPLSRELNRARLEAEQEMQRLVLEAHLKDFAHHVAIEQGSVWEVLSAMINQHHPNLLVLGTHGRGALERLALGSVAEEVLRLALCPVLTVGPKCLPSRSKVADFHTILFATDFGAASTRALPLALRLAEDCKAKLVLLHMVPLMPVFEVGPAAYRVAAHAPAEYIAEGLTEWQSQTREQSLQELKQLIPSSANLASQPEYVVATDFLPEGISNTAARYGAELIIMGANRTRSPRLAAHMPWAVVHEVLCTATSPVLTVRS